MRHAPIALALALVLVLASAGRGVAAPAAPTGAAPARKPTGATVHAKPKTTATAPVAHRPLTLSAQNILGRAEGARVLFVHTGPTIALEDAPKHPSYLRDDFTAALSSPVTVHVRNLSPLRTPTTPGGSR